MFTQTPQQIIYTLIESADIHEQVAATFKDRQLGNGRALYSLLYSLFPRCDTSYQRLLTYVFLRSGMQIPPEVGEDAEACLETGHPLGEFRIIGDHGRGAVITGSTTNLYCLACDMKQYEQRVQRCAYEWFVLNDPHHWLTESYPLYVKGPFGIVVQGNMPIWENDFWVGAFNGQWVYEGVHTVICRMRFVDKNDKPIGGPLYCTMRQTVSDGRVSVDAGLQSLQRDKQSDAPPSPSAIRRGLQEYLSLLDTLARSKPMSEEALKQHGEQAAGVRRELRTLQELEHEIRSNKWLQWPAYGWLSTVHRAEAKKLNTFEQSVVRPLCGAGPIVQAPDEDGKTLRFLLLGEQVRQDPYRWNFLDYRWKFLDWTNLAGEDFQRMMRWKFFDTPEQAMEAWQSRNRYPKGWAGIYIPQIGILAPEPLKKDYWVWETNGQTDLDAVNRHLGYGSIAAILLTAIVTVPVAVPVLMVAASTAGAIGGAISLYQNHRDGVDRFAPYALDVLQIVTSIVPILKLGRGFIKGAGRMTLANQKVIENAVKLRLTQGTRVVAEELLVGKELFDQCRFWDVFDSEGKTPKDVLDALVPCIQAYAMQKAIGLGMSGAMHGINKIKSQNSPSLKGQPAISGHSEKKQRHRVINLLHSPNQQPKKWTDEYEEWLRKRSPSEEIRQKLKYMTGKMKTPEGDVIVLDPLFPRLPVQKLEVDHIVPFKKIIGMDGFEDLSTENQLKVLNYEENFIGMAGGINASRQDKTFREWAKSGGHFLHGTPVNQKELNKLLHKEEELDKKLRLMIDDLLKE